ncbi:MAG: ATP-dependent 6-phosphofructokinase [Clostridia bacterium]|nr:ATP-dependent 6-phosphofructokinase [Clostridia bacterium]
MEKIAVITSGGDAPGMNACLKSVVEMSYNYGYECVAFRRAYKGIIDNDYFTITKDDVKNIFNLGGSMIYSARCEQFLDIEYKKIAVQNLNKLGVKALVVIGGNGSYLGAKSLVDLGVNVIAIPATIDNDVHSTSDSIGFDSAVNNATNMIDNIRQTMQANERICLIECMGRHGGNIALYSAMASEADIVAVPEDPLDKAHIYRFIQDQLNYGNRSPTIVVAEKQYDIFQLSREIQRDFNHECRAVALGYMQRGGSPTVKDRMLAIRYGVSAIELIDKNKFNFAIGLRDDKIIATPIDKAVKMHSNFRQDLYDSFKLLNNPRNKK